MKRLKNLAACAAVLVVLAVGACADSTAPTRHRWTAGVGPMGTLSSPTPVLISLRDDTASPGRPSRIDYSFDFSLITASTLPSGSLRNTIHNCDRSVSWTTAGSPSNSTPRSFKVATAESISSTA